MMKARLYNNSTEAVIVTDLHSSKWIKVEPKKMVEIPLKSEADAKEYVSRYGKRGIVLSVIPTKPSKSSTKSVNPSPESAENTESIEKKE